MHLSLILFTFAGGLVAVNAFPDYYEDYINYNVLDRLPGDSSESSEVANHDETFYENAIDDKLMQIQYDPLYSLDDEDISRPRDIFALEKKSFNPHRDPNKDRGNRNAEAKFAREMVQCYTDWTTKVDLYDRFKTNKYRTEFHRSMHNLKNGICRKVDTHHGLYVPNPCAHFPNNDGTRLCYIRGNTCYTSKKSVYIWMRNINETGHEGPWRTESMDLNVGCQCNYEFHHHEI